VWATHCMHHRGRTIATCASRSFGLAKHVLYVRGRKLCADTEVSTHALLCFFASNTVS
jgi:hypothetical protein